MSDPFAARLDAIVARRDELAARMSQSTDDYTDLAREYAELEPVVAGIEALRSAEHELYDLRLLADADDTDPEMRTLAGDEIRALEDRLPTLERAVQLALLPRDVDDEKSAILEVRAGTGGEEAALFAGTLLRMYQRFAELQGWRCAWVEGNETELGGVREAVVEVQGRGAFARLKFEAGVHRVQRVPVTESGGRIHTSAATVAVLPEAEAVDVDIDDGDLRIDVYRASGAGGQHVNRTESAVRITHLASGIVVAIQDEKSQHKNKAKAMKLLRARLYDAERRSKASARSAERKGQVGSGDRSERIRTYNFPQGRVTDHRINLTLYKLEQVLSGEALGEVVDALIAEDQAQRLAEAMT
ncbi:MAG: peptide chain release factor 1 [Pseudomonadota bacterium]